VTELWRLGVDELAAGKHDPAEVITAFAARAREVDRLLNCFVAFEESAGPGVPGPLGGIPYAYKDVFVRRDGGRPSAGLPPPPPPLSGRTATVLERLDGAGAVALGRLNLDPLGYAATGLNGHWGDVRNPWRLDRIAGGSSSGAAAAVAAGAVAFAVGTDAGGSVRIPSALCGVTGLKPTFGRIPTTGSVGLTPSQETVGVIGRSALGLCHVLASASGLPMLVDAVRRRLDGARPLEGLVVAVDTRRFAELTAPVLNAAARRALDVLASAGAEVREVDLALLDRLDVAAVVLTWAEASALHGRRLDTYPVVVRRRLEAALAVSGADHVDALRYQGRALGELLSGPLAGADVLVLPTVAGPAREIAALADPNEAARASLENLRLNRPLSFAGLPSIALPIGFDDGLPLAFQLAGRPWSEELLLTCAAAFQHETEWHRPFPPLSLPREGAAPEQRSLD
jgi:aspartyl-tRNA(Asn)/glutamyl-tRNA(Gln) amidotransferase subunit A